MKDRVRAGAELLVRIALENFANVIGAHRVDVSFRLYDDKKSPCQWQFNVVKTRNGKLPRRPSEKSLKP